MPRRTREQLEARIRDLELALSLITEKYHQAEADKRRYKRMSGRLTLENLNLARRVKELIQQQGEQPVGRVTIGGVEVTYDPSR